MDCSIIQIRTSSKDILENFIDHSISTMNESEEHFKRNSLIVIDPNDTIVREYTDVKLLSIDKSWMKLLGYWQNGEKLTLVRIEVKL